MHAVTDADVATLQADAVSWPTPSLAVIRGTFLGWADFTSYFPPNYEQRRGAFRDGKLIEIPRDQWRALRMEEQVDAVLYLGPPSSITIARLPPALCSDPAYLKMRMGRLALFPGPSTPGDCAIQTPK